MRAVQPEAGSAGLFTLRAGSVAASNREAAPVEGNVADGYIERVRAYIPVEIIAFFIFVNSLVNSTTIRAESQTQPARITIEGADAFVAVAALAVGAVATVVYAYLAAKNNKSPVWTVQATVSLCAFLVWTYAMGGNGYHALGLAVIPSVAGLLLATFTLFSGFVVPVASPAPVADPVADPVAPQPPRGVDPVSPPSEGNG